MLRNLIHELWCRFGAWRGARLASAASRHLEAGDSAAAERLLRRACRIVPAQPQPRRHLAQLSAAKGDLARARALLEEAVRANSESAECWSDLATVLQLAKQPDKAIEHYERALRLDPANAPAWNNLGVLHREASRLKSAKSAFMRAAQLDPGLEDAIRNLVGCQPEEQDELFLEGLLRGDPARPAVHAALGFLSLKRRFNAIEALRHLDRALALGAEDFDVHFNRGIALQDVGRIEEAIQSYERALRLRPASEDARWNRSLALLLMGRFDIGWEDYELRFSQEGWFDRNLPLPRWNGRVDPAVTLLVHAEQGLGDEIMFASCLDEAASRVGGLVVECNPKLAALFRRSFPNVMVQACDAATPADWWRAFPVTEQVPLGSLGMLFRRSPAEFPEHSGYLRADPVRVDAWRKRLDSIGPGRKVGISWRGGTARSRAALRSLELVQLAPLLDAKDVHFVSLQYDVREDETEALERIGVHHWREAIDDYDETAALVCALDVTVSVCTAVVHLAGALGRPVYVLAPHVPEWRYGAHAAGMPWYPAARVFRQSVPGDWGSVISRVAGELKSVV